jgi:hypothetical protein
VLTSAQAWNCFFFKQSFVSESCRSYALKELRHPLDTEQTLPLDLQQAHQLLVVSRKGPCPPHSGEQLRVQHASRHALTIHQSGAIGKCTMCVFLWMHFNV